MAWFLGQSIVIIGLAFVLGLVVGWLLWGRVRLAGPAALPAAAPAVPDQSPREQVTLEPLAHELEPLAPEVAVPEPAVIKPVAPPISAKLAVPQPAAAEPVDDDLERIEGIGPKMAAALRLGGVRTYRQLADCDEAALQKIIEASGLRFAPSLKTWARQARLLADGDEAAFVDLIDRLIAGRDVGR